MSKVDLRTLESVTGNDAAATALLNANFEDISEALDNAISRDGTAPNYMDANLDMNNKRLINLADPENDYDAVNKKYFTDTIGNAASYASQAATSATAAASSAQSSATSAAQAIAELQAAEATINAAVQQAVNTASGQAAASIANYVNTVVEPSLQNIANMAQGYSNNASNSANLAMAWASQPSGTVDGSEYSAKYYAGVSSNYANNSYNSSTDSSNYANSSYNSSANSSNYANNSLSYSNNSSNYANNAAVWAEGTDVEVAALGGEHSAKVWSQSNKRNIGEIIESVIPLTDAGLHLLDGSLIQGGGIYDEFVQYVAGLVSDYPDCFTTEAAWQQSVTDYGVCGKFVYDSVNNTVRLPKYSDKIYTTDTAATAPVIGNGNALGLYAGNDTRMMNQTGNSSGALNATRGLGMSYSTTVETAGTSNTNYEASYDGKAVGVSPDEDKSGLIANLSNIIAPVEGYYYIVVATSVKTDIEVDIDQITVDLANKANKDLSNVTAGSFENVVAQAQASGKETVAGWPFPSTSYEDLILGASGTEYTATESGYYTLYKVSSAANQFIQMINIDNTNDKTPVTNLVARAHGNGDYVACFIPCKKGNKVIINYTLGGATQYFRFCYADGEI